jgi:hypothetical protein
VKGKTAPSEVSSEETPSSAAELTIIQQSDPLESPSPAAELTIRMEPDENSPTP